VRALDLWLLEPRTPVQIIARIGWPYNDQLPRDTLIGSGQESGIRRTFYWRPTGTNTQAKQLARREIDIANARLLRDENA